MENSCAFPFAPPISVRRGELWAKHMGYKCGAIGNILRNTLKTWGNNATHKETN